MTNFKALIFALLASKALAISPICRDGSAELLNLTDDPFCNETFATFTPLPTSEYSKVVRTEFEEDLRARYEFRERFLQVPFADGRTGTIFYQTFHSGGKGLKGQERPKHLLYVHGLNSYGGRIARFVEEKFLKRGIDSVTLVDLPNFGRSSGTRAHITDIHDSVLALRSVVVHLRKSELERQCNGTNCGDTNSKLIAYGTSLGSHVLMRYQVEFSDQEASSGMRIDGYIFGSPLIKQKAKTVPPPFILSLLRQLNYIVPTMPLLPPRQVYFPRDPDMEIDYRSDPLIYTGKIRLSTALAFLKSLEEFPAILDNFTGCPFLVLVGANDTTICTDSAKEFYSNSKCTAKDLVVYEDTDHDIPFERHINDRYFSDIVDWIHKRF